MSAQPPSSPKRTRGSHATPAPAPAMSTPKEMQIYSPPHTPALAPSYSQISTVYLSPTTKLISLAGQVGHDYKNSTSTIPASFPAQVRLALRNVETLLAAAGASKRDIISNRQYVVRMSQMHPGDIKLRADILTEWFEKDRKGLKPPPDTLIGVESLAPTGNKREYLFEIEVVAIVHEEVKEDEKGMQKKR